MIAVRGNLMNELKLSSLKILVAEDNVINQKIIRIILDRNKCNYEMVEDGNKAVKMYESGAFNLVLMDCQMPDLDGLQASKLIRDFEKLKQLPRCYIVALTANTMLGDREKCISAGMDGFLSKPFKSQELVEILKGLAK